MEPLDREALRAIGARAFKHSTAIVERLDAQFATVGSGTFFEFGGRHFVVTAAHVILEVREKSRIQGYRVALASKDGQPAVELCGNVAHYVAEPIDIAVIELRPEQVAVVGVTSFATLVDVAGMGFAAERCLIGGCPSVEDRLVGNHPISEYVRIVADLLPGPPDVDGLLYPPGPYDIWCEHSTDGEDLRGGRAKVPELPGISGSGMWGILRVQHPGAVWSPTEQAKLIGIQKSFLRGRHIRGTLWVELAGLLAGVDSQMKAMVVVRSGVDVAATSAEVRENLTFSLP